MAGSKKTRTKKAVKDLKPRKAAAQKVKGGLVPPQDPVERLDRKLNRSVPHI